MRYCSPIVLSLVCLVVCLGCQNGTGSSDLSSTDRRQFQGDHPIQAIATVGMVADILRNVGGEHLEVTQIMGAGVDPHLYKATRDDVKTLLEGDIIFYNGLMLEGKMSDKLIKVANRKPVIAVTERIDESQLLEPDDLDGHYDPHVWMDVSAWSKCVDVVAESLAEFDPKHAEDYQANAKDYQQTLAQLHAYGKKSLSSIPTGRRVLITSHDAFNYFGRAYNLEVLGVQGLSTESEAGLQRVNELVELIVAKKIQAVFVESSVPRKNIEALIEGAQSQGHNVTIGGELYSDAMGEEGTYEGTYPGMLDHNITLVTKALGGDAPETGMQGKLAKVELAAQEGGS